MAISPKVTPDSSGRGPAGLTLTVLAGVQFVLLIGTTVVMVSLPSIRADLEMSAPALQWVITAYMVGFGGLLLVGGRLVDVLGGRRMLLTGLLLVTVGSLLGAIAPAGWVLILARGLQGIGAALASPAGLFLLAESFAQPRERRLALGIWAAAGAAGAALGNVVGGLLTTWATWRWIFLAVIPVMVILVCLAWLVLPTSTRGKNRQLGMVNALLATAAVVLLLLGLAEVPGVFADRGAVVAGALTGALILAGVFFVVERRSTRPLLPRRVLTGTPRIGYILVLVGSSGSGIFFLSALYMQDVLGFDALQAGLRFIPWALAIAGGAQIVSRLLGRLALRQVLFSALSILLAGLLTLMVVLRPSMGPAALILPFVLMGLGQGMVIVTATNLALGAAESGDGGVVASIVNSAQQVGAAIFVAAMSTVSLLGSRISSESGAGPEAAAQWGVQGGRADLHSLDPVRPSHSLGRAGAGARPS